MAFHLRQPTRPLPGDEQGRCPGEEGRWRRPRRAHQHDGGRQESAAPSSRLRPVISAAIRAGASTTLHVASAAGRYRYRPLQVPAGNFRPRAVRLQLHVASPVGLRLVGMTCLLEGHGEIEIGIRKLGVRL
jgi:hypothetical protein